MPRDPLPMPPLVSNAITLEPASSVVEHRVLVAETDMMKIVYHGNYIQYLERGRLHYMRKRQLPYREVVARGLHMAIVDVQVRHKQPARFDDLLATVTSLGKITGATVSFSYSVYRIAEDGSSAQTLLATASTRQACVDEQGKPRRLPRDIAEALLRPEATAS